MDVSLRIAQQCNEPEQEGHAQDQTHRDDNDRVGEMKRHRMRMRLERGDVGPEHVPSQAGEECLQPEASQDAQDQEARFGPKPLPAPQRQARGQYQGPQKLEQRENVLRPHVRQERICASL